MLSSNSQRSRAISNILTWRSAGHQIFLVVSKLTGLASAPALDILGRDRRDRLSQHSEKSTFMTCADRAGKCQPRHWGGLGTETLPDAHSRRIEVDRLARDDAHESLSLYLYPLQPPRAAGSHATMLEAGLRHGACSAAMDYFAACQSTRVHHEDLPRPIAVGGLTTLT